MTKRGTGRQTPVPRFALQGPVRFPNFEDAA